MSDLEGEPWVLGPELDLHTFAPRDVTSVVEEYLLEARQRGWTQVRLIHGRGIGVQREAVRRVLARTDFVIAFEDDPGSLRGATWVTLAPL